MKLNDLAMARRRRRIERSTRKLGRILEASQGLPGGAYVGIALQYSSLGPWEAAALAYMRQGDTGQIAAVHVLQAAKNARWVMLATLVAAFSVPVNVALTLWLR
jgi:hypothetical protein